MIYIMFFRKMPINEAFLCRFCHVAVKNIGFLFEKKKATLTLLLQCLLVIVLVTLALITYLTINYY